MSKVGSYGYERQRTTLELKENVCVAPISVPTTLYSGVDTLPEIWRRCLKKGYVHTSSQGVLLKGTKSGRSLRIRKHKLKRPKQLQ